MGRKTQSLRDHGERTAVSRGQCGKAGKKAPWNQPIHDARRGKTSTGTTEDGHRRDPEAYFTFMGRVLSYSPKITVDYDYLAGVCDVTQAAALLISKYKLGV